MIFHFYLAATPPPVERGLRQLEQDRNYFPYDLVIVCSKEGDPCEQIINRSELGGFDPFANTFVNDRVSCVGLFKEVGNGVESLRTAGAHRDLCPSKNVEEFTFGVKSHVRVKANAIVA
jgi:hypothetical protein